MTSLDLDSHFLIAPKATDGPMLAGLRRDLKIKVLERDRARTLIDLAHSKDREVRELHSKGKATDLERELSSIALAACTRREQELDRSVHFLIAEVQRFEAAWTALAVNGINLSINA